MRVGPAKQRGVKRKYATTDDSPDVRNTVGAFYAAAKKLGYSKQERDTLFSTAGFEYPERTLRRYAQHIEQGSPAVPSPGKPGRPRALTPGEERLFCGWVLAKNQRNCGFGSRVRLPA